MPQRSARSSTLRGRRAGGGLRPGGPRRVHDRTRRGRAGAGTEAALPDLAAQVTPLDADQEQLSKASKWLETRFLKFPGFVFRGSHFLISWGWMGAPGSRMPV